MLTHISEHNLNKVHWLLRHFYSYCVLKMGVKHAVVGMRMSFRYNITTHISVFNIRIALNNYVKIFNEQLSYLTLDSHTESMQHFANKNASYNCSDNLQCQTSLVWLAGAPGS